MINFLLSFTTWPVWSLLILLTVAFCVCMALLVLIIYTLEGRDDSCFPTWDDDVDHTRNEH